jgi:hypothetical protein
MITFMRTLAFSAGKADQILSLARQSRRLVKARFGLDLEVRAPVGGDPNRIADIVRFRDLAEFEAVSAKISADPDFRKLTVAHARNVTEGSSRDEIWRDVDLAR